MANSCVERMSGTSTGESRADHNEDLAARIYRLENENNELKEKLRGSSSTLFSNNENDTIATRVEESHEQEDNLLAESSWDDTTILDVFNKAVKSHRLSKSNNEKRQRDSNIEEDGELVGEPGPWQTVSSNNDTNEPIKSNKKICINNEHLPNHLPSNGYHPFPIDEALNDMLAAWYHSGYMSGRYAAYSEMAAINKHL